MNKKLVILASGAILALSGCTVTQINHENLQSAPSERVYIYQTPLAEEAIVEVVRLNNFAGGGCYLTLVINEERAARLDVNESATFHLPPGEYVFQNTCDWDGRGLCALVSEEGCRTSGQIRKQKIEAGKKYTFRIGINSWSGVKRLYLDKDGVLIQK